MPSAEQWLDAQGDVWDIDAERQSLEAQLPQVEEQLRQMQLQEAELCHTLRCLRQNTQTPPPSPLVEFEALLGSELSAWREVLGRLDGRRLARLAGKAQGGAEVLAQMAVRLVRAEGAAGSCLEELVEEALPARLSEGSFFHAVLKGLCSEDPECEAWLRGATEQMLEALRQLSSDRAKQSKSLRRFSRAFVQPEITKSQSELPTSVADFIGEPEEALPQLSPPSSPKASAWPPKEVELMEADALPWPREVRRAQTLPGGLGDVEGLADALVEALEAAADAAPVVLCRLAAALPRQELLGTLLLSQWLAPALQKPSSALGLGLEEVLPVLMSSETTYSLRSLVQTLMAAGQAGEGDAPLRRLCEALALRGRAQAAQKTEAEAPCCLVCRASELVALGSGLSGVAEEAAEILEMDVERVRLLGRRPSNPGCAAAVVWLARPAPKAAASRPPRRELLGAPGKEEALLLLRQLLADPKQLCGAGVGAEGSLLAALAPCRRGHELTRQLKMELLQEALLWQEPSSSEQQAPQSVTEEELFLSLQESLQQERAQLESTREELRRRRRQLRRSGERCRQVSEGLRRCARAAWTLRFHRCLQTLWGRMPGGPPGELTMPEHCVIVPEDRPEPSPRSRRRRRDGLFSIFGQEPGVELPSAVRLVKKSYCPFHRLAAVGASMGVENLANEASRCHYAAKNLREILAALSKLRQNLERLRVPQVIQELVALIVGIISKHCRLQASSQEMEEDPMRPHRLLQGDEEHLTRCVSRFIFHQLHHRLFPSEPTVEDQRTSALIHRFAWLRPRHLDLPRALVDTEQARQAVALLRKLHQLRSPLEMLDAVAQAFRVTTEAACLKSSLAEGLCKSEDAFGADEALPIFILVVIRANPPMLHSVLSHAEQFSTSEQLRTEQGYALAQAKAAVSFSERAKKELLSNLKPGEWESHMEDLS